MSKLKVAMDIAMCALWILTYTLVLIGTVKYRYPLISPITQMIIAPLEWSVTLLFIKLNAFRLDYASCSYLYWSIVEIVIIGVMIKNQYIKRKWIAAYIFAIIVITALMIHWVVVMEQMFFFTYLNTFIGMVCWLGFVIRNRNYPMKGITLAIFVVKFVADILAFLVYFGEGHWTAQLMCVLLPICQGLFILVYLIRKLRKNQEEAS